MSDISVQELHERLQNGTAPIIIDVREQYEWDEFHIGGQLISLGSIQAALPDLEDHINEEIVVVCRSGARSSAARDFLVRQGFKNVRNLTGGVLAWQASFGS